MAQDHPIQRHPRGSLLPRRKAPVTNSEALLELDRIDALLNQGISPEDLTLLQNLPISPNITLEHLQAERQRERDKACRELDEMAKQFAREDEERRRLWGTKFPRRLGDKPPENEKSINQVKKAKRKRKE